MKAVRANESRVPFLGFRAQRIKLIAFIIASNVAALSGALYPMLRGFVSPELFFFQASGNAVITVIVGGLGTLIGPLYGSVLLTGLKSVLGTWTEHHLIVIGILFMLSVIFFPQGLIGYLHPRLAAWLARKAAR
jgi:branched-chain amino acid transport system permease protein